MKAYVAAIIAAIWFVHTPVHAELAGGDVDLPETVPMIWDAGNGKRCVLHTYGTLKVLELVENHRTIAVATFLNGKVYSAFDEKALIQGCRRE
ncbi:MAG: hypothetical protein RLZZ342_667 [Candidatus Parcubacteria bacterium]|jgi:hypothetical protein